MRRVLLPFLFPFLFVGPIVAQDDVLVLGRGSDVRAYAGAVRLLRGTRLHLTASEMTPRQLCRTLTLATDGKLMFTCGRKVSEAAPVIDREFQPMSLWSIMAVAQLETGLRFVFRHGLVMLLPADGVEPQTYLRVYDLRAATAPLRSFPGPDLRLRMPDDERPLFPEEGEPDTTVSGFTAEDLESLLRETVRPESWEVEGISLNHQNGVFLIRQTLGAHREIDRLFVKLGVKTPTRTVRPVRRGGLQSTLRPTLRATPRWPAVRRVRRW